MSSLTHGQARTVKARAKRHILPVESREIFQNEGPIVFGRAVLPFNQVLGCWQNSAGRKFFGREGAQMYAEKMHRAIVS